MLRCCFYRFASVVDSCLDQVQLETQNSRDGYRLFQTLQQREMAYMWRMLQSRLRKKEEVVMDERSAKSMTEYTELCIPKLKDLLNMHTRDQEDADLQVLRIEKLLVEHRVALSRIFQYYWCVTSGAHGTVTRRPTHSCCFCGGDQQRLWRWEQHQHHDDE